MANPTRTYLLLEERLGSPLARYVRGRRLDGRSWDAIALDLHTDTQIPVTGESLRAWFPGLTRQWVAEQRRLTAVAS